MLSLERPKAKQPLVVDVTKIDESTWFCMKGCFHSDAIHVTERLTRKGDTLTYSATVEDPKMLAKPWKSYPVTRILAGRTPRCPRTCRASIATSVSRR